MSHQLNQAAMRHAQEEFRRALDASVLPYKMGQLELFTDEEERFIQQAVERKLHTPSLPNAGSRERLWMEKLKAFSRDESLVVVVKMAAGRYASAIEALLPRQEYIRRPGRSAAKAPTAAELDDEEMDDGGPRESKWLTLPGSYYTQKPVTAKTNKSLFSAAIDLKKEAGKDMDKWWLAEFLLKGEPEPVSNFKMECLYLLRGADGNVTRLVRLVNKLGEMSSGPEVGGTDILPAEEFGSAEKFRVWCQRKGNFCWGVGGGAGNLELQMLHADVASNAAYKVARLIEYCGWHGLRRANNDRGQVLNGIWFNDECAFTSQGEILIPDEDGVVQYDGEIYVLARKGREADFAFGRPAMRPAETLDGSEPWLKTMEDVKLVELDKSEWEPASLEMPVLGGFFRETCRRFEDTAGGLGGWMAVGAMLGYAAGPEFFEHNGCLPSIFIPGQMGSGKTVFTNWLMGLQGYQQTKGLGLGKGSRVTPVGLCQQLENYSSVAVWFDEYRQYEIGDEKISIIRDSYDRQLAGKWTPDGIQRVIRTTPIVSGETDTSDAATRSRYTHLQLSASQRRGNHINWMRDNRQHFFFFWRHLMMNRPRFVEIVMRMAADWFTNPDTANMPERSRVAYSLAYVAFAAATVMFESHSPEEISAFRKYIIERANSAADDVSSDVNVNVFMQDVITAFKADAIPPEYFRVEKRRVDHPPGAPNQGMWYEYDLFMDPNSVISALQIYLRKAGQSVTLRSKDLRDQLSKNEFWITVPAGKKLNKRFGKRGQMTTVAAWGIRVDQHPLGLQRVSDEAYREALSDRAATIEDIGVGPIFEDGDPRKGELFSIIEGVEKHEARERREETGM